MKRLENSHAVTRELDECPALVRWLKESRDENRVLLEGSPIQDLPSLQGQNSTINQILDKVTDLE